MVGNGLAIWGSVWRLLNIGYLYGMNDEFTILNSVSITMDTLNLMSLVVTRV